MPSSPHSSAGALEHCSNWAAACGYCGVLKRRKGSVPLEAVLILPIALLLLGVMAQALMLSQARVHVQQAAFAAARSALVHKCLPARMAAAFAAPGLTGPLAACSDRQEKWEDAARWALIAASPSSDFAAERGNCPDLTSGQELLAATGMASRLGAAVTNKLCYAFEPENVDVEVAWIESAADRLSDQVRPALKATVRFRYPLTTPIGLFLADDVRSDGTRWRWGEATAVLL